MERFKPPMSKVKPALGIGVSTVLSFKPPMSKVKLDKYTLYISSKSKKVNKKAPKKPKSPSMSKFKSVKTG